MVAIVGVVRFSVLSTARNPFALAKDRSFEDFARRVLDPRRLDQRLRLFQHVTLPSLDAQTDPDFAVLVLAPERLEAPWRQRLGGLAERRPWLQISYHHEADFRTTDADLLVLDLLTTESAFATFRLDDDDAVSIDYIARVRRYVTTPFNGHSVSLCKGWQLDVGDGADLYGLKPVVRPNIAVGLAHISRKDRKPRTLFGVSDYHLRHHERVPTITDGKADAFVALTHETNDTGAKREARVRDLDPLEAQQQLTDAGFNLDLIGLAESVARTRNEGR
ncbi:glycosyltransferase [Brevundimonas sp.]|uniref:glycosyltransferase n=1 Tax=Brevundimonas sp. TaxID=1871086 RepID=UPI0035AF1AEC